MKVVFLDIDGVLCLDAVSFESDCVACLRQILDATDAKLIITSSRRSEQYGQHRFHEEFRKHELEVAGVTVDLPICDGPANDRIDEILHWVEHMEPDAWVVIDDLHLLDLLHDRHGSKGESFAQHFVQIDVMCGLQPEHVSQAIAMLTT